MNDTLARAQQKAIALQVHSEEGRRAIRDGIFDVWVVTDVENGYVYANAIHSEDAVQQRVSVMAGIRCLLGDEVVVARVGGSWVVIGCLRTSSTGFSMLQAEPIIVPSVKRTGNTTWGNVTLPVEMASLRATIPNLDPGMTYMISARGTAYLTSASTGTRVALGMRVGYPGDPQSVDTSQWGPGHQLTTPTLAFASFKRVVSSVTEMQVTVRGWASALGNHTVGDGQLDVDITPLYVAGRI